MTLVPKDGPIGMAFDVLELIDGLELFLCLGLLVLVFSLLTWNRRKEAAQ